MFVWIGTSSLSFVYCRRTWFLHYATRWITLHLKIPHLYINTEAETPITFLFCLFVIFVLIIDTRGPVDLELSAGWRNSWREGGSSLRLRVSHLPDIPAISVRHTIVIIFIFKYTSPCPQPDYLNVRWTSWAKYVSGLSPSVFAQVHPVDLNLGCHRCF